MTQKCFVVKKKRVPLWQMSQFFSTFVANFWWQVVSRYCQRFLFELDIKPPMHLVKIIIFSPNSVTVRLTKIVNNLLEHLKILIFKVIFQHWKLVESFNFFFIEEYWTIFLKIFILKISKDVPNFCRLCS